MSLIHYPLRTVYNFPTMNFVYRISQFLTGSISVLHALLAVFIMLFSMAAGSQVFGGFGLFAGASLAVAFCGLLAVLINIRDLLSASLKQQG